MELTRRDLLLAIPAMASTAAEVEAAPSDAPSSFGSGLSDQLTVPVRLARLAQNLSDELAAYNHGRWFAVVLPGGLAAPPIMYLDLVAAIDAGETTSPGLIGAITAHCAAYARVGAASRHVDALTPACGPLLALAKAELGRAVDAERYAFMTLCSHPARNGAERRDKATYLLGFCQDGDEREAEHVTALLKAECRPDQEERCLLVSLEPHRHGHPTPAGRDG